MITFRTLGEIELLNADGKAVRSVLAQPKRLALLACLAVPGPGTFHRREIIVARLWPELDDARGRGALNTAAHFLRQALGSDVVVSRGQDELGLDPALIHCDAADFEAAHRRGDREAAANLYRGDLLHGFYADDAAAFERWVDDERVRLRRMALEGARAARVQAERSGDVEAVARWAVRVCDLAPLDEGDLQTLLRALAAAGRRSEAVAAFERFKARAAADLETQPSPATLALVASLVAIVDAPAPAAAPDALRAPRPASSAVGTGATPTAPLTAPRGRRWSPRLIVAALTTAIIALSWRAVARDLRPAGIPADARRIVVLPFLVHGDSTLAYLEEGVVDLLSDRLALPGRLYPVDPRAVVLSEREERLSVGEPPGGGVTATRFGAEFFVTGSVTRVGPEIQLAATLHQAAGARRATAVVTVAGEEAVLEGFDAVARQLLAGLYDEAPQRLERTAALTTTSLEALRAYLGAQRDFRQGRFDNAVAGFQRATELDTTMAIAYYGAAVASEWTGRTGASDIALTQAWRLRDRLPEPALLLLSARRAPTPADRIQAFRGALVRYPDLVEARYEIADLLFHYGHWGVGSDEVRAAFEGLLSFDANHPDAMLHLARIAAADRDEPTLRAMIRSLEAGSLERGGERGIEARALHAFAFGDPVTVSRAIAELLRLDEESVVRIGSRLARYGGRTGNVDRLFRELESRLHAPEVRAFARTMRAALQAAGGRPEAALGLLDVSASPYPRITVAGMGLVGTAPGLSLSADNVRSIRAAMDDWRDRPGPPLTVLSGYILQLTDTAHAYFRMTAGILAARAGDSAASRADAADLDARGSRDAAALVRARVAPPGRVIATIGRTSDKTYYDVMALETFDRARAFLAMGDSAEADRWLGAFTHEHPFSFLVFPQAWLERARLADAAGRTNAAATHYARFIEAWLGAEPAQRPVVDEARARLAALRGLAGSATAQRR